MATPKNGIEIADIKEETFEGCFLNINPIEESVDYESEGKLNSESDDDMNDNSYSPNNNGKAPGSFKCTLCSSSFKSQGRFDNHMKQHSAPTK